MTVPSALPGRLALAAIVALGAALRLSGLDRESFWHDEAWSWAVVHGSLGRLLGHLIERDAHPPLYFLILHAWSRVFGESEAALRSLSAIFGIAVLPIMYRLAGRIGGVRVGLLAALFLALSPYHVLFSQEARSYTLVFLLAALSLHILRDLLERPTRGRWVAFAILSAAVLYTHYMGAFFLLSETAAAAILGRDKPAFARGFALAAAGAAGLFLPWMPFFVRHLATVGGGFWIPPLSWEGLVHSAHVTVTYVYAMKRLWAILVTVPWYFLALGLPLLDRRREHWALLALLLVPPVGEMLVSLARPLYYARTFLYVLIPLFALAAIGLFRLPRPAVPGAAVFLALSLFPGLHYVLSCAGKENWRGAAAILDAAHRPGERILVEPGYAGVNLEYYAKVRASAWAADLRPTQGGTLDRPGHPREALMADLETAPGVWLVLRYGKDDGLLAAIEAASFGPDFTWRSRGAEVHHFRRR